MARTQMRLDAITGSLVANDSTAAVNEESLQGVLDRMVGSLERHHGGEWYSQPAGVFSQPVQIRDSLNVTGSADIDGNLNVDGGAVIDQAVSMGSTLEVASDADLNGALDVAAAASLAAVGVQTLVRGDLRVDEAADLRDDLAVAGEATLASAIVSDLTAGRVTFAGTAGALIDSAEMQFAAGTGLTLANDLSARSGSFSGDLEISGNLVVQGDTVTVNVAELLVEDKDIVVAKDATTAGALDGAGMKVGSGGTYANLTWSETNSKWSASEQLFAPVLQSSVASALYMKSDADGDLIAGNAGDLVDGIKDQFTGSNIAVSDDGAGLITYSLTAGTGVFMDGEGEIAIGQPVGTTDNVTFADLSADSAKLADHSADAGKAYKVGTDGAIVPATWDEFVSIEANVGLELIQDGFKAQVGLAQDIRSSASPEFAALNIGTAHDIAPDGSDLHILTTGEIKLEGADGAYMVAESGDFAAFSGSFGPTETIIGALNTLSSKLDFASPAKFVERLSAPVALNSGTASVAINGFNHGDYGASDADKDGRFDVFVNGQLLTRGAGDDFEYGATGANSEIDFKFALEADDVISVVIR